MDGIIVVNKPKGYTSHDVVNKIRKIYNIKKVGHTGTLDPNATGVLPILVGKATKLSEYLMEHDKTYIATIKLGERTDTGDSEGNIIERKDVLIKINDEIVSEVLKSFLGKQLQIPPIYSAIKVNGKKLYEYARNGENIEINPREITIYLLKLESIKDLEIKIKVKCSKGTYIRSLCEDISSKLGTVGYMKELERVEVDKFSINESYTLDEIENNKNFINIISIEEIFERNDKISLDNEKLTLFLNGGRIKVNKEDGIVKIYSDLEKFIGTGKIINKILKRDIII